MYVQTPEEQFRPEFEKAVKGRLDFQTHLPWNSLLPHIYASARAVLKRHLRSTCPIDAEPLKQLWLSWVTQSVRNASVESLNIIWTQSISAVASDKPSLVDPSLLTDLEEDEVPVKTAAHDTTAIDLLSAARDIQVQRAKDYDQPGGERSMLATVQAFNIITRRDGDRALTESEGWLLMQTLKDVRDRSTKKPHRDSLEDGISYSSLKAEARLKEV